MASPQKMADGLRSVSLSKTLNIGTVIKRNKKVPRSLLSVEQSPRCNVRFRGKPKKARGGAVCGALAPVSRALCTTVSPSVPCPDVGTRSVSDFEFYWILDIFVSIMRFLWDGTQA
jgi:hypothetical protein